MRQYLLSIYQPVGEPPAPEFLEPIMAQLNALSQEMKAAGAWVFTAGLHPTESATVVRDRDGEIVLTDGPFAEGKEYVGGLWIVRVPDLDDALGYARRITAATTLPVEVRPFHG